MATDCLTAKAAEGPAQRVSPRELERLMSLKRAAVQAGEGTDGHSNLLARVADGLVEVGARLRAVTGRAEGTADRLLGAEPANDGGADGDDAPSGIVDYLHRRVMEVHRGLSELEDQITRLERL